jgi:hypothetical protein
MGISVSLLLAAAGAALIWAVNASLSGVNIHTIGVILPIVGVVGSPPRCSSGRAGAASAPRAQQSPAIESSSGKDSQLRR